MTLSDVQFAGCLVAFVYLWWTLYRQIIASILTGRAWRAALLTALTSPVMLLALAMFAEGRPFSDFTDLGTLPWSVVFGDGVVLPVAAFVAAKSAPAWYDQSLATNPWWMRLCLLIGLGFGLGFHQFDGSGYRKAGFGHLVASITKMWHDLAVYSILIGMLLYALVFVMKFDRPYRWLFPALLGLQLVLMAIDATRGLNPPDMHTACDLTCGAQNLSDRLHDVLVGLQGWMRSAHLLN